MKKIFSVILVAILALSLAGCRRDGDGEVAVFYYTYSDAYISSVRSALDKYLDEAKLDYNDYDLLKPIRLTLQFQKVQRVLL